MPVPQPRNWPHRAWFSARMPVHVLLACLAATPIAAQTMPRPAEPAPPVSRVAKQPECTCRAAGQSFGVGSEICIGNRMMRCTMAINVTSWEQTDKACPQS